MNMYNSIIVKTQLSKNIYLTVRIRAALRHKLGLKYLKSGPVEKILILKAKY